jgi:hypothetical protein
MEGKMISIRYILMVLLAVICLAACGGGKGGGKGDGAGGESGATYSPLSPFAGGAATTRQTNSRSEAIGSGPSDGLGASTPASGINGFTREADPRVSGILAGTLPASADPVTISIEPYTDIVKLTSGKFEKIFFTSGTHSDMTYFSNGLVGLTLATYAQPFPSNTDMPGVSGNLAGREVVMLGGGAVKGGLEYTNFGFWENRATATGIRSNGKNFTSAFNSYRPFILESAAAATKKFSPPASTTFTGAVVANAYDRSDLYNAKVASLVGTAKLTVNSTALAGDMKFYFDNFYTMSTLLTISSGGAITPNGGFSLSDHQKNTTKINLTANGPMTATSLSGQFYGASANNASEAVGTFSYSNGAGAADTVGVKGSWGVNDKN